MRSKIRDPRTHVTSTQGAETGRLWDDLVSQTTNHIDSCSCGSFITLHFSFLLDMGKQISACHVVVGVISWGSGKVTSVDFASFYLVIPLRIYFSPWGQGVDSNQRVT